MIKMKESLSQFTIKLRNIAKRVMNKKDDKEKGENDNEEKDNKKKIYSILSPIKDANITGYKDALDFVFSNDSIKNVAISGAYCSGKP